MTTTYRIVDGDWDWDEQTGRPVDVADGEKLLQDLTECLSIEEQSNGFGAGLDQIVGTVPTSPTAAAVDLQLRSIRAVNRMANLQLGRHFVQRPLEERVVRVQSFAVNRVTAPSAAGAPFIGAGGFGTVDPAALSLRVDVLTAAGQLARVQGTLT